MMTITDVQRQHREAAQQRKRKAMRIASSFRHRTPRSRDYRRCYLLCSENCVGDEQ